MTHLAPNPVVHNFLKPICVDTFHIRLGMEPEPPSPALFILDSKVSAGWEIMADTTPATTPDDRATPVLTATPNSSGFPKLLYILSATRPCTANLAMVYGTCLNN